MIIHELFICFLFIKMNDHKCITSHDQINLRYDLLNWIFYFTVTWNIEVGGKLCFTFILINNVCWSHAFWIQPNDMACHYSSVLQLCISASNHAVRAISALTVLPAQWCWGNFFCLIFPLPFPHSCNLPFLLSLLLGWCVIGPQVNGDLYGDQCSAHPCTHAHTHTHTHTLPHTRQGQLLINGRNERTNIR